MKENTVRPELNNPETKARFAFQYYGQPVFRLDGLSQLKTKPFDNMMEGDHLELTPLDHITDEDAIACAKFGFTFFDCTGFELKVIREGSKVFVAALGDNTLLVKIEITNPFKLNIYQIDYLRSIGIALPWNGYSVEELIQAGYCQLRKGDEGE